MKKIFLIIIFLICITGCTCKYSIKINKDGISEYLVVEELNKNLWNENCYDYDNTKCITMFKNQQDSFIPTNIELYKNIYKYNLDNINKNLLYDIKYIEEPTKIGFSYKYDFDFEDYKDSTILNSCIENFKMTEAADGTVSIEAHGKFICDYNYMEKLVVEINSDDYDITNDNADNRQSGKYIWNINLDGYNNIHLDLVDKVQQKRITNNILIISISVIILLVLAYLVLNYIRKRNNQI